MPEDGKPRAGQQQVNLPNRKQRRAAQFNQSPPPKPSKDKKEKRVKARAKPTSQGDTALWCSAGAMGLGISLVPNRSGMWTAIFLIGMAALLVHPVLYLPWIARATSTVVKVTRGALAIVVMVLAVAFFGWVVWPHPHRHDLATKEQKAFQSALSDVNFSKPTIHFACPANDEASCVYAAQFISLFGNAGPRVLKLDMALPILVGI
jgi:hypothetical protein